MSLSTIFLLREDWADSCSRIRALVTWHVTKNSLRAFDPLLVETSTSSIRTFLFDISQVVNFSGIPFLPEDSEASSK